MTNFCVNVNFWPVGQGLFSSGCIKTEENSQKRKDKFHWIYDCGSIKQDNNKKIKAIASYNNNTFIKENKIDLVAISHFHKDHISGLEEILKDRTIRYLLLPYMPLWQRLFIGVEINLDFNKERDKDVWNYLINPIAFLEQRYGKNGTIKKSAIDTIIIVPSSPDDIGESIRLEETDDRLEVEFFSIKDQDYKSKSLNVFSIKYGSSIVYNKIWEFLPYNDNKLADNVNYNFVVQIQKLADEFKRNQTDREDILNNLKKLYEVNLGKLKGNRTSLFLYCGPLYDKEKMQTPFLYTSSLHKKFSLCLNWLLIPKIFSLEENCRASILYTGDGYLTSNYEFDQMEHFFDKKRIKKIAIFQVMHHGSRSNWYLGLANKISPLWSIFSADPAHKNYKHPHQEVLRDFVSCHPVLVNDKGAYFFMYCL